MRAVQLQAIGSVGVVEVPDPEPGDGEIVVRVTAAGMCGSDRHLVSGEYPGRPPVVLGHEFEGIVVAGAVGDTVSLGDRVTVDPNIHCGVCARCADGLVAHCTRLSAYGVDRDGGFAQHVRVLARQAHALPPELPEHLGALSEPVACCLRAMDHADVQPGDSIAVVGGGVIGQLLVQLARLAGGTTVILSTRQRRRREVAESHGATASIDPSREDPVDAIVGPSGIVPGGVDVVFDAAGAAGSFEQAIGLARPAGTVVVVGAAPRHLQAPIMPFDIFDRELRILGSHLNPYTHARAAWLIASGALDLEPLITRTVGFDDLVQALTAEPAPGEIKIMLAPS
ncbi:MAG: alcohol dehydrogenase catalytic domain-containing protein [Microlunatus sp.]|nr:alcohol dehydrogenase catalytic domain-containing protein [Microlunatus sp.]